MTSPGDHGEERAQIQEVGRLLSQRGLAVGSSGNISVRTEDGFLMTPTGASLGTIDPASISLLDGEGELLDGAPPTKETFMHLAFYEERPSSTAIIHLHATHSVAVACLDGVDESDVLPPLTAYYIMRIGSLPLVPYYRPGDRALADAIRSHAHEHHALLLANHGPIVAGADLQTAMYAIEELEETAKLFLLLRGDQARPLTAKQVDDVRQHLTG